MRYLPPLPLSIPAGPTSSMAFCQPSSTEPVIDSVRRRIQYHWTDFFRVEERHEVDRIRIRGEGLIFPVEQAGPIDDLVAALPLASQPWPDT